jgi:predicted AlkP superfamily phosphohydrolase/phosphomutase
VVPCSVFNASPARLLNIVKSMTPLLAACAVSLALVGCDAANREAAPAAGAHKPLIVLGIDGATWDVIDPMIANGELPNLARLKAGGAWAQLITVGPQVSPVVWTTFATGQFGRQHGILDFVYPYQPGPRRPVQSTERRSPALWNLASDSGQKVCVVGYFVTYPAEQVNGAMVSYNSFQQQPAADYPEQVLAPIRADLDRIYREQSKALWARFLPWDFDPLNPPAGDDMSAEAFKMVSGRVEKRILQAEYNRRAALYLADSPADVFISYFGLVDFASHSLWKYYDDRDYEVKPDAVAKRLLGDVVPESYRFIDAFIGDLLAKFPQETNIVILSDHGFGSATGIFRVKASRRDLLTGNHRPNGIFLAAGPDISPGAVDGMTIVDVFPVLAYLSGLPIADDLPGDLDLRLFREASLAHRPAAYVPNYDRRQPGHKQAVHASLTAQQENVKSLQGLGYVGESFELAEAETGEFDVWAADSELVTQHLTGEISFHLLKGDELAARALLDEAQAHDDALPIRLLRRARLALQSIREAVGEQAVPDSAFAFIRSVAAREMNKPPHTAKAEQ